MSDRLSLAQARRVALAAQGFDRPRPAQPTFRDVTRVADRLNLLQIDSVNIVERAHLVPLYSRLGPFDRGLFDRAAQTPRRLVETWAHEASFTTPEVYHLMEWRRRQADSQAWGSMRRAATDHADVVARVRDLVADLGPITAREIQVHFDATHPKGQPDNWGWNWSVAKGALEYLFFTGELASAGRTPSFERRYDLAGRVIPPLAADLPTDDPSRYRRLVDLAARAHGVGTVDCLADYFRLPKPPVRQAVAELTEQGTLVPVRIDGWGKPAWRHADARLPRAVAAQALLAPFDALVFHRPRLEALFGFHYRLEYYLPPARRRWGYYVMPFLLGDRLAARADLKANRQSGRLELKAWYVEEGQDQSEVASALAEELASLATWLDLAFDPASVSAPLPRPTT